MNLEELSAQLEQAVDNLFIMWLTYEEGRVAHSVMSNALHATYEHLNNISLAITDIVEKLPGDTLCKIAAEVEHEG